MGDIKAYESRLDGRGWRVFQGALEDARRGGQNFILPEHIIKRLADEERELFGKVLQNVGVEPDALGATVRQRIEGAPRHSGAGVRLDAEAIGMFKRALARAQARGRDRISTADMLVALSQDERGTFIEIFKGLGAEASTVVEGVRAAAAERDPQPHESSPALPTENAPHIYVEGDTVRIKSGAFSAMSAKVTGVDYERLKVTASVRVFGRRRTVEVAFAEVEKLSFERT